MHVNQFLVKYTHKIDGSWIIFCQQFSLVAKCFLIIFRTVEEVNPTLMSKGLIKNTSIDKVVCKHVTVK